jgi:hypothetical protein
MSGKLNKRYISWPIDQYDLDPKKVQAIWDSIYSVTDASPEDEWIGDRFIKWMMEDYKHYGEMLVKGTKKNAIELTDEKEEKSKDASPVAAASKKPAKKTVTPAVVPVVVPVVPVVPPSPADKPSPKAPASAPPAAPKKVVKPAMSFKPVIKAKPKVIRPPTPESDPEDSD